MSEPIGTRSIVKAITQQATAEMAGEAVVLDLKDGVYYSLDNVGARVWDLVQEPRSVGAIRDSVVAEFAVESERCERDVLALLQQMATAGLIEICS